MERRGWAVFVYPGFSRFAEPQENRDFIAPGVQGRSLSHYAVLIKSRGSCFLILLTKSWINKVYLVI